MKKILFFLYTIFNFITLDAQEIQTISDSLGSNQPIECNDSLFTSLTNNVDMLAYKISTMIDYRGRYKMYKTENLYNLLKLDTATGIIKQVQWSLKGDQEFSVPINTEYLSFRGENGTFELYPTNNMYQFILLDTTDGRTWHVQWGTEDSKRWIRRIY